MEVTDLPLILPPLDSFQFLHSPVQQKISKPFKLNKEDDFFQQ